MDTNGARALKARIEQEQERRRIEQKQKEQRAREAARRAEISTGTPPSQRLPMWSPKKSEGTCEDESGAQQS